MAKTTLVSSVPPRTWALIAATTVSVILLWLFLFRSNSSLFPTNLSFFPLPALLRKQTANPQWQPNGPPPVRSLVAQLPSSVSHVPDASIAVIIAGETPPLSQKGLFHLMKIHLLNTLSIKGPTNVHTFVSLFDTEETLQSPTARDSLLHRLTTDLGSVQHVTMKNASCDNPELQSSKCCSLQCGDVSTCLRFHAIQSEIDYAQTFAIAKGFHYKWFVIIRPNVGIFDVIGRPLDAQDSLFTDTTVYAASREERLPSDYFMIVPNKRIDSFESAASSSFSSCIENDSLEIPFFGALVRDSTPVEPIDLPLTLVRPPTNNDKTLVIDGVECYRTSLLTNSITRPLYTLQQMCVHSAYSLAFRYPF